MRSGGGSPDAADATLPVSVLLVDDDPAVLATTAQVLDRESALTPVTETTVEDALAYVEDAAVDCIVSDYDMPTGDGLAFLDTVREAHGDLPFILFTGKGSEEIASEAISRGVTDYLQKGTGREQYELLVNRIENAVARYRAERAVQDREELLTRLLEGSTDIIAVLDDAGVIQYISPAVREVLGYDPAALEGADAFEYIHPEDRAAVLETFTAAVDGELRTPSVEYRFRDADGGWRWLESRGTNRLDHEILEGYIANARDVTARHERKRELERYETLLETVPDGVYSVDAEGRFTAVNDYVVEQTGYDRSELLGSHVSLVIDDEDVERGVDAVQQLLSEADTRVVTYEETIYAADGTATPAEARVALLTDDDGTFVGTVGTVRDISARKQRESELERYETIVETVSDGVYAMDEDDRYEFVNSYIEELTGYDRAEIVGASAEQFLAPADLKRFSTAVEEMLAGEREAASFEVDVRRADGDLVPTESRITLLPHEDGYQGTAGVIREITEQKRRERELRRQNERLEAFARVVSHDLRNPLNVAQGRIDLARQEFDSPDLAAAAASLERMATLIDDVLALARQGRIVDNPAAVALHDVVAAARATSGLAAENLAVVDELPVVAGDEERIRALFENVFANAVEHGATGSGGDLTVTVGTLADGFYIADDGQGIPPEDHERIFEPGYSTSERGTGLGLSLVEEIGEAHGWSITVVDSEDGGARFEITGVQTI